jgi:cytochrome c biogenesis protein CcdA
MSKKIWSLAICLLLFVASIPLLAGVGAAEESSNASEVCAYYFYRPGCGNCAAVKPFIDELQDTHSNFNVREFDLNVAENSALALKLIEARGVSIEGMMLPIVVIGDEVYSNVAPIKANLEAEILAHPNGLACPDVDGSSAVPTIGIVALLGAAAVDAINPCALAVLVLLLTTVLLSRRRKVALYAGLAFSVAVYLSYLLMGFGLFSALNRLASFGGWMKTGLGALAIVVGLFNLKDYFSYGAGGFTTEVPMGWRPKLKKLLAGVTSVPGAFLIGLLVSLFLLPCTSGPYIVVIGMLANHTTFWSAVPLLLLYNFVFVLPMLVLTWFVYYGLKPSSVEKWRVQKIRYLHLFAGIVLTVLGVLLLSGVL